MLSLQHSNPPYPNDEVEAAIPKSWVSNTHS